MKTSVILKSTDRTIFDVTIRQDTKKQFLSVTDLQKAYDKARWQHGWPDRRISDILNGIDVKNRIYYVLKERGMVNAEFSAFMEMAQEYGIVKLLKKLDQWKTTGRGDNKQVMCDPYIWILIALELNPLIYAKVVIWMTDSLIFDRIEAGDEYMPMNKAISTLVKNPQYAKYAILINEKVFGHHTAGMRNIASSKELRKISEIEKFVAKSIESNFITSEEMLINFIKNY